MTLAAPTVRFYLTGRVCIEGASILDQSALPGRQGRLALVYLVARRHHPVPVDELAEAVWHDRPPSWDVSLRAVVSKVRTAVTRAAPGATIASDGGCYQAILGDGWVDVEAATNAIDRAEGARRRGDEATAWSQATVAAGIARRPILPGEDLAWIDELRGRLGDVRRRALDVLVDLYLTRGDVTLAISLARELTDVEPYREAAHRQLMRAHAAAGDRAEAVRVHDRLRRLLAEDLGVDPSPETEALFEHVLRGSGHRRPQRPRA